MVELILPVGRSRSDASTSRNGEPFKILAIYENKTVEYTNTVTQAIQNTFVEQSLIDVEIVLYNYDELGTADIVLNAMDAGSLVFFTSLTKTEEVFKVLGQPAEGVTYVGIVNMSTCRLTEQVQTVSCWIPISWTPTSIFRGGFDLSRPRWASRTQT